MAEGVITTRVVKNYALGEVVDSLVTGMVCNIVANYTTSASGPMEDNPEGQLRSSVVVANYAAGRCQAHKNQYWCTVVQQR